MSSDGAAASSPSCSIGGHSNTPLFMTRISISSFDFVLSKAVLLLHSLHFSTHTKVGKHLSCKISSDTPSYTFTFKYVNEQEVIALGVTLPIVGIFIVGLRFLTRRLQNTKRGVDDWLILSGLIWLIGMGICLIDGRAHNGAFGSPTPAAPSDFSPEEEELYTDPSTTFGQKIFMILAYGSIKLSIIAFYRRIFVVSKNDAFNRVSKISAAVIFLWTVAFIFIIIFDCGTAVWANWGSPPLRSLSTVLLVSPATISDFLVDIYVLLLPLPIIWKLRLSLKKKIAVSGIFLLGAS
ncbi:putative integral membrane protein [Botrytis fragariae]|uniref:Putative integral membrane protein n=1 Tax=Botrytis fragariae TaxID=1964551 RepID=A0A8H6AJ96_9HELO|nr:putative integral membrane protein [Botrytis fragariae]KAF5868422.1 putative integral membrane protein [Botrytis fragariae]